MNEATAQVWKDRYEIERPLGRGGMSAVYLAKDRQLLSKKVVVKVLLEEMAADAWVRQKFFQEMEALARIDHPGVVGVLDTGQTPEGKQFLVMQYVEGQSLRAAIPEGGMPLPQAASLIRQIGQALAAAHDAGVWHRDLKPENVMIQRSGGEDYAKLIDFGIAGIQNSQFTGERTKVAGSLSYMAPEQFAGNACAASDIYALAVVAYEILTGEPPFGSNSMTHLVTESVTMPLPRSARADIPEAAECAILRGLSFKPEARQASVREFTEELYAGLCAAPQGTRRTAELPGLESRKAERPSKLGPTTAEAPKQSKKVLAAAAAVVVVVGGAVAGWLAMHRQPEASTPAAPPLRLSYQVESPDLTHIAFRVATPDAGYLYLLSYGKDDSGKFTFNLLHPLNAGEARREAGQTLRVPKEKYYASTGGGGEVPYLVWSAKAVPEIEALKWFPQAPGGEAMVEDPAKVAEVLAFLKSHHSESLADGNKTDVRTNESVLVHAVPRP